MNSARLVRQITLVVGASAIVAMGALTAGCSSSTKEEPKTTQTPSSASSSPVMSPTEKAVGGPSSFSPTVHPAHPGDTCAKVVNGVCSR